MMFVAGAAALVIATALCVARAWLGPTVYDRVLAANTLGTLAVGIMAIAGFIVGRTEFLDVAIVYALLNVMSTLAVLKFFRYGSLGDPGGKEVPRTELKQ